VAWPVAMLGNLCAAGRHGLYHSQLRHTALAPTDAVQPTPHTTAPPRKAPALSHKARPARRHYRRLLMRIDGRNTRQAFPSGDNPHAAYSITAIDWIAAPTPACTAAFRCSPP